MREASLTDGRCGRDLCSGGERWRPLAQHLGRCPTVAEIAAYLDVAEHQIVGELATGWSAGSEVVPAG